MKIAEFLEARIAEDEALARAAGGSTVEGERGAWSAVEAGDEWEVGDGDCEVEVLVALRQNLARPPEVMDGRWGAITIWKDVEGPDDRAYVTRLAAHIARHDPALVLAECAAKRRIIQLHAAFGRSGEQGASAAWLAIGAVLEDLAGVYTSHPDYNPEWT